MISIGDWNYSEYIIAKSLYNATVLISLLKLMFLPPSVICYLLVHAKEWQHKHDCIGNIIDVFCIVIVAHRNEDKLDLMDLFVKKRVCDGGKMLINLKFKFYLMFNMSVSCCWQKF